MVDKSGLIEGVKAKLIETKQRWASEGRLLTGETARAEARRLPPGQREVQNWPVLDLGAKPDVRPERWRLRVTGLVENPLVWDWQQFLAQPQSEDVSDMHCVTSWSRFENRWKGVSAKHLLSLVKPLPTAKYVVFHAYDGYTTNLPLADFDDDDVFLVHEWDGKPLTREHGGPVRALVPKLYLWKSAKWINRIEFLADDRPGFWEERGYNNHGDPWTEERYS